MGCKGQLDVLRHLLGSKIVDRFLSVRLARFCRIGLGQSRFRCHQIYRVVRKINGRSKNKKVENAQKVDKLKTIFNKLGRGGDKSVDACGLANRTDRFRESTIARQVRTSPTLFAYLSN